MAKTAVGLGTGPIMSVLRLGNIKGPVSGTQLARNLFNVLNEIKRSRLPIRIYLTREIVDKIALFLDAMGIRYILKPVEEMEPPYIFIDEVDGKIIVLTANEEGEIVTIVGSMLDSFLDSFINLFKKRYSKKSKKILRLIESGREEGVETEGVIAEVEGVETEVSGKTGEDYAKSIEETLKGFESK